MNYNLQNFSTILTFLFILFLNKANSTKLSPNSTPPKRASSELSKTSKIYNKEISSFLITNSEKKPAVINFKIKKSPLHFILGISDENKFVLNNNQNFNNIEIDEDKLATFKATTLSINSLSVKGDFQYNKINQWKLYMHDSFTKNHTSLNWDFENTTKCKFYNMLGGNCQTSDKEISKEISDLPEHTEIKIVAAYHFIGEWDSHTGYLKLDGLNFRRNNPQFVWTDRCITKNSKDVIKLCDYKICRMNALVNVSVFHKDKYLKLIFGSTLKRTACEQAYAVSDVKIYIR
jgi:hypothetical protein